MRRFLGQGGLRRNFYGGRRDNRNVKNVGLIEQHLNQMKRVLAGLAAA